MTKQMKNFKLKFWVPKNLDIDAAIKKNKTSYMCDELKKEYLIYIVDALVKSRANNWRDLEELKSAFTPLSSELLDLVIHNYKKYLAFLIEAEIIVSDNYYLKEEKCTGYCFSGTYAGQRLVPIEVSNYILYKGIKRAKESSKKIIKKNTWGYSYLTKWWDTGDLRIDVNGAFDWIAAYEKQLIDEIPKDRSDRETEINRIIEKCEGFKLQVIGINEGGYKYGFSGKGHRFYNPISNLKKELRNYLSYDKKDMVSIDIKNSQPYFSIVLHEQQMWEEGGKWKEEIEGIDKLNRKDIIMLLNPSEIQSYQQSQIKKFIDLVVGGEFYEYIEKNFSSLYPDRFNNRDSTKKEVLRIMYANPAKEQVPFYEPCLWFEQHFPITYRLFKEIKSNDYTLLPVLLQRLESFLVIDTICKKISNKYPDAPLFTIHDSIITTKENSVVVESIMKEELEAFVGHKPTLFIEELTIWKPIVGYEGLYEISDKGEVRGIARKITTSTCLRALKQKTISTRINNCGYTEVRLSKGGKTNTCFIHVLLAQVFIEKLENKSEVNHKDGIKSNNSLSNLEWVTHAENMQHAYKTGLYRFPSPKSKKVVDTCTGRTYNSISEAAAHLNIAYSSCKNMVTGRRKNTTCLKLAA